MSSLQTLTDWNVASDSKNATVPENCSTFGTGRHLPIVLTPSILVQSGSYSIKGLSTGEATI